MTVTNPPARSSHFVLAILSGLGFISRMMKSTTMTEYLKEFLAGTRDSTLCVAIRETEKAVGVAVGSSKRIAWFPKSQLTFVTDDYYTQPEDKFEIPGWLIDRKAAELGVLPHWIGERS
jgi:hypothetical protein